MNAGKQQLPGDDNGQSLRLRTRFKAAAVALCKIAEAEGEDVAPFSHPEVRHFSALDHANKKRVLDNIERVLDVCQQITSEGGSVMKGHQATWRLLRYMRYVPRHDVLNLVGPDNIVEIYSLEGKILFASMNFFKLNYYSLEDVYCRPWYELYERDADVLKEIHRVIKRVFDRPEEGTQRIDVPLTPLFFRDFPEKDPYLIRPILFSPIYRDKEFVGMIDVIEHKGAVSAPR